MIPRPAQYLLRLDDLCPTMPAERWKPFLALIEEFRIRPILAVVPENRDPDLELAPPDPDFWARMRSLESAGATIGLHGYRHLAESHGRSLVPLHRDTEFAGAPQGSQRAWIREGVRILRGHGLNPRIWVAPRHGFDRNTLRALREEGLDLLSDGFARVPFVQGGVTWIPQQLWGPVDKPQGLWTICMHPSTARDAEIEGLRAFLRDHAAQFTSVDRVVAEFRVAESSMAERLYGTAMFWRIQASRASKQLRRGLGMGS